MADINSMIARPPLVDWNALGDPLNSYAQGKAQKEAWDIQSARKTSLADLPKLQDGSPDFSSLFSRLSSAGDYEGALKVAPLARQQSVDAQTLKASEDFYNLVTGGRLPSRAPQASSVIPTLGSPPAASAVPSSAALGGNPSPAPAMLATPPAANDPTMTIPLRTVAAANAPASASPPPITWGDGQVGEPGALPPPGASAPPAPGPQLARPPIPTQPNAIPMPALMAAVANPRLPQGQREVAKILLDHQQKQTDLTNEQREYMFAVRQGETDTFTSWMRKNKGAGATVITNDMRAENAEGAALGKSAGERAGEAMQAASRAPKTLATLNRATALLSQIETGKLEPTKMSIAAWGRALGADDATIKRLGLDPAAPGAGQALTALFNEMTIGKIGPGGFPSQNFSNTDLQFITGTVPALANEPRANKILIEVARRNAQLDIAKGREWMTFRRDPANKGRGYDDFEIAWADKMAKADLFGDLQREAEALIGPRDANASESNVVPPAFRTRPPEQQMQAAPENSVRRSPDGRREIRRGNQWVPYDGR
jgi:hypothetical protein